MKRSAEQRPSPQISGKTQRSRNKANVAVTGASETAKKIVASLRRRRVETRHEPKVETAPNGIDAQTLAVVIVDPSDARSVARLRPDPELRTGERALPVLVVTPEPTDVRRIRALYRAGAAAVFEWPRDRDGLLLTLTRLLGIGHPLRSNRADNTLARAIRDRLRADLTPLGEGIEVRSVDGVVFLSGEVDCLYKVGAARRAAASVAGVQDVVAEGITVTDSGIPDRKVTAAVRQLLSNAAGVDASTVAVSVCDGVATVAGSANTRHEMQRILDLVRQVRGVRGIQNFITLAPGSKQRDRDIAAAVNRRLVFHFPTSPISVSVFDGVAVLDGVTHRADDRRELERIALHQDGVGRVVNKVRVARS
jgi:osmotically-inducible protein OsmY